jgi:cell division protein FtsL
MVRLSIAFLLVILCCATNSFAAVTTDKWQQELEMKLDEKINKVEARNVQLENKVNQLENQRILDVSLSFIFYLFLLFLVYC